MKPKIIRPIIALILSFGCVVSGLIFVGIAIEDEDAVGGAVFLLLIGCPFLFLSIRHFLKLQLLERHLQAPYSQIEIQKKNEIKGLEVSENEGLEFSKEMRLIIERKRHNFLNIPSIAFHFADEEQIKAHYNNYFKEPTIESLVSEITGLKDRELTANIPKILESRIGGQDISKWISTIKLPEATVSAMFLRYQRETIKNRQVTLGIEEIDVELTELQSFSGVIQDTENRFAIKFEPIQIENHKAYLKEKAAERTLTKLEKISGDVLIEGRFKITIEDNFYKCTYVHPVMEYLSKQVEPITISVLIPTDRIEINIAGNYAKSVGRSIPLRIYGRVWQPLDRKSAVWELQITPLAIY